MSFKIGVSSAGVGIDRHPHKRGCVGERKRYRFKFGFKEEQLGLGPGL